jgi:hypothetical protein
VKYTQQQLRRALRTARKLCDLDLTAEDLAAIADRIQHHHDHPNDVAFIERFTRRLTSWRVRIGRDWYRLQYDTHRHVVDAFNHKESERPDVGSESRVEVTDRQA